MFAIDSAGNVNGQFTEGDPATGVRATRVSADWLNMIQGELLAVLPAAGMAPNRASGVQLIAALRQIFVKQGGGFGQLSNTVAIGWSAGQRLRLTIDTTDLGPVTLDRDIADVWRASNDGAGSGLDADTVRGYVPANRAGDTFGGGIGVQGDITLPVAGCRLYQSAAGWGFYDDAAGRVTAYYLRGDNSLNLDAAAVRSRGNVLWNSGNDGAGSGLDADTVRGYVPANRAGDTFGGSLYVAPSSVVQINWDAGHGGAALSSSGPGRSGYVAFYNPDGSRAGYVGFAGADGRINHVNDKGLGHSFGGPLLIDGATAWHAGNDGAGSGLDADLLDGHDSSEFVLANGAAHSFGATGWERLPSGRIRQWGETAVQSGQTGTSQVAFPIAFPNACMSAGATNDSGGGLAVAAAGCGNLSKNGMTVSHTRLDGSGQGAAAGTAAFWWAEGY